MLNLQQYSDKIITMYDELSGMFISSIIMNTLDFINIGKTNGVQRYTTGRLQKALKNHLKEHFPTHSTAALGMMPDGTIIKLDCHTRSKAWIEGYLPMPKILLVTVFHIDEEAFSERLYEAIDNKHTTETASDHVFGSARGSLGHEPTNTSLFNKRGMRTALEIALNNGASMSDIAFRTKLRTPECIKMVQTLDEHKFKPSLFNAGFLGAIVLSVLRDGDKAMEFWLAVANGEGSKHNGQLDAIEMAFQFKSDIDRFKSVKSAKGRPRDVENGSSRSINNTYCMRVLPFYEAWKVKRTYKPASNSSGWTTRSHKNCGSAALFMKGVKLTD